MGDSARDLSTLPPPPPPESGSRITVAALGAQMLYRAALGELAEKDRKIEALRHAMRAVELALRTDPKRDELSRVLADYLSDARREE